MGATRRGHRRGAGRAKVAVNLTPPMRSARMGFPSPVLRRGAEPDETAQLGSLCCDRRACGPSSNLARGQRRPD